MDKQGYEEDEGRRRRHTQQQWGWDRQQHQWMDRKIAVGDLHTGSYESMVG